MNKSGKKSLAPISHADEIQADALYTQAIDEFEAQEKERKSLRKKVRKLPRVRVLAITFGVLVVVYGVIWLWPVPSDMPSNLVGMWRTNSSAYADRFIELHYATISFGTGHATASTGFIKKVELMWDGNRPLYHVSYLQEGHELRLSFYYDSVGDCIRLKNQQGIIWKKEDISSEARAQSSSNPYP